MSEVTSNLKRMLAQSQGFSGEAPLEAQARAELAVREVDAALRGVSDAAEREQLLGLRAIAVSRVERYTALNEAWNAQNSERADLFAANEQIRLDNPIHSKI